MLPIVSRIWLTVASVGEAEPPVTFALTVPAAIGAKNELVMPCELRETVTAPLTVLAAIGAVPETEEMPGAG